MSSRSARKAAARQSSALPASFAAPPVASAYLPWGTGGAAGWGGSGNGHQGADFSRLRGMVYFPELDTRREINSYNRTEILRRVRFLYGNYGIARRAIDGLARMVAGTGLTYQAATDDKEWNALAEKAYKRATASKYLYDLGGRYNGGNSQRHCLSFRFRDGDCAQVLTRDPATGAARFAFYESHQIGNAYLPTQYEGYTATPAAWRDGVRHDAMNRAIAYRVLGDESTFTDVPAQSILFQCDYARAGQSRGLSALSHAVNHLLDSAEITSYIKAGVKLSNRHGYWIETATGAQSPATAGTAAGAGKRVTVTTPSGPITIEKILGAGEIPDLQPGQSIKFNSAANPHPNQLGLLEHLIRDVAWGCPYGGVAPELLWNITSLGSANTRFVLADAQSFIEIGQQSLVDDKCQPELEFILACEMAAGRLRVCRDPEWQKSFWIPPPRITIDFGRDGKLNLEQVKAGALTFRRLQGWQGQDSDTEREQWLDEMLAWKQGAQDRGLDPDLVLQSIYGRPGIAPVAEPTDVTSNGDNPENPAEAAAQLSAMVKRHDVALAELHRLQRAA